MKYLRIGIFLFLCVMVELSCSINSDCDCEDIQLPCNRTNSVSPDSWSTSNFEKFSITELGENLYLIAFGVLLLAFLLTFFDTIQSYSSGKFRRSARF